MYTVFRRLTSSLSFASVLLLGMFLVSACSSQVQPNAAVLDPLVKEQPFAADTRALINEYSGTYDNVGIVVLTGKPGMNQVYATGMADSGTQRPASTDDLFEIGSASKMFTAVAIQQLIEAGKLSLDTPVNQFFDSAEYRKLGNFKGKNYWDKITVAMFLNHTSGIIDYLNVYHDDAKALKIFGVRGHEYSVDELVSLATKFGDANFIPGEGFSYSNTGYILLGEIISKVSGMDWHDYIRKNIFDIVGMNDTWFASRISAADRQRVMRSNFLGKATYMPPTLAGSAGEVVSNLDDLAKFLRVWAAGELYTNPATLARQLNRAYHQMRPETDVLQYGYGAMLIAGFYGHGGQTFGFQAYIAINPESGELYVIGINDASVASMDLFLMLVDLAGK